MRTHQRGPVGLRRAPPKAGTGRRSDGESEVRVFLSLSLPAVVALFTYWWSDSHQTAPLPPHSSNQGLVTTASRLDPSSSGPAAHGLQPPWASPSVCTPLPGLRCLCTQSPV